MFRKNWFDITVVSSVCEIMDRPKNGKAYEMLRTLHCVHYNEMNTQTLELIPHLISEVLSPPAKCVATDVALSGVKFGE
jgi:hypothetical protein